MRLRQICLVAENRRAFKTLADLLDSPTYIAIQKFAQFGLENGLIMTGVIFVEVVSRLPGP